jgi:hypothetical protein
MILYEEILREFQKHKVRYILVGGIAVNLLGFPRSTADLDILVEMSDKNLRKIVTILKKRGYKVKQPVDPMLIADKKTRLDWIKNKHLKAFNFYKEEELKEVDIILKSPVTYASAIKKIVRIRDGDLVFPVISIKDIIKMKNSAGRDLDKFDVAVLKKIEKRKK